jgi:hypothetical protein
MARRGRSARNVLSDLKAVRLALPSIAKLNTDTHTITKSKQVHALVKYLQRPKAIHLSIISKKNNTAKTILTIFSINMSSSLSWRLMSSKHRLRLEAKIKRRMVHSKNGLSTTSCTNWREAVQDLPRHVLPRKEQQEQSLSHMRGQQASGTFLVSASPDPPPSVFSPLSATLPTPSSKVKLLLGPVFGITHLNL